MTSAPLTTNRNELDLTIMIPAYLEAESLSALIPRIHEAASALTPAYEVLIVDTQQPKDNTQAIALAAGARHIFRSGGDQYGDAIRTGFAAARGRHLLCMDADGSHNPIYFASMWAKRDTWDITIGSRYVKGGHTENPKILIFMSWILNITFRVSFKIKAKDVTNSFRLYRMDILRPIKLESNAFDIIEELLIKAVNHRPPATVGEVPVTFEHRKAGESKRNLVEFAFKYLSTLRRLRKFQQEAKLQSGSRS
jgi:dolichol-phosphate mannosyltransferase